MPRKKSQRASSADVQYQLVIAPVSGTAIRTFVSSADIAALLGGERVLLSADDDQSYVAELVPADGAAPEHHGRARPRASAVAVLPAYIDEASELAGSLG